MRAPAGIARRRRRSAPELSAFARRRRPDGDGGGGAATDPAPRGAGHTCPGAPARVLSA
ncbi:predicted protein [Streptomyces sp. AA4]|nr:predicted protein [Streptomyces sp. AA4]